MSAALPTGKAVAGYGLALLFVTNILNIADRALLGIVTEPVRHDLALSDTQISIVSGFAFVLFNLVVGVLIAGWIDRGNRKLILAGGIALWSAATALTGYATGFTSLAAARVLVGVGEATAFPVALSLIADYFRADARPRAVAIFQTSSFVGIVIGAILAGVLAAAHGWRSMFGMFGVAGIVVALLVALTLRNPPRGQHDTVSHAPLDTHGLGGNIAQLLRLPGFGALMLGYAFSGMAVAVLPTWAPAFLLRSHQIDLADVGKVIGPAVGLGGITGTILSGIVAGILIRRRGYQAAGLLVPIAALPLAAPLYAAFLFAPTIGGAMAAVGVTNFLLASSLGPCVAIAVGVVPTNRRALASTLMLVAQGLIGAALAPFIVGAMSDALKSSLGEESLRYGLTPMIAAPLLASLCLWIAYRRMRDTAADQGIATAPSSTASGSETTSTG